MSVRPVFAQVATTPALFLEAVRDPGNPDVASTARSLALGGVAFGSGGADEAPTSPATLVLGPRVDAVVSAGSFGYSRDELIKTPGRYPPLFPERARTPTTRSIPMYAAMAARRSTWAVAGFYDASATFKHNFDTATSNIFFTALGGTSISEDGTGHASVSQRASRIGGTVAAGPSNHRAAIGVSVAAVRLDYDVLARVHVDRESSFFLGPITRSTAEHENRVVFDQWRPGIVLSAMGKPFPNVLVSGRWSRVSRFAAKRSIVIASPFEVIHDDQAVQFQIPSFYAVGAMVTVHRTVIAGEATRTAFSQAFQPALRTAGFDRCVTPLLYCPGWGVANYDARDVTLWRGGIEQRIAAGGGDLIVRGGASFQPGYTVARPTDDPFRNGGSFPAPLPIDDEEPPRADTKWLTGGAAWRWNTYEIGVAVGRAQTQTRLLVDFRIESRAR